MEAAHLEGALDTARRCGLTADEALKDWELAGGVAAGDAAIHWALIAVDLAVLFREHDPEMRALEQRQ